MFYVHYFHDSPGDTLVAQVFFESIHMSTWAFSKRHDYHDLVKALVQVDRQVNPDCYSEDKWSPSLMKSITDALK